MNYILEIKLATAEPRIALASELHSSICGMSLNLEPRNSAVGKQILDENKRGDAKTLGNGKWGNIEFVWDWTGIEMEFDW